MLRTEEEGDSISFDPCTSLFCSQNNGKERLLCCTVPHLLMVTTDPQKKVAALQRYSWIDIHDTPRERTQLKRSYFTLGVVVNFLLGEVSHLWMGNGVYFYTIFFPNSIITTGCSSTLSVYGDNSLRLDNLRCFCLKTFGFFFAEQKQGPHMQFSGEWQPSKYWLCQPNLMRDKRNQVFLIPNNSLGCAQGLRDQQ